MNELKIFENEEFGNIRVVIENNEPLFCLKDVCMALGITQASRVKERLNKKGVRSINTLTKGGNQKLLYVNESNLYKVIFQSRKQSAQKFTEWVTGEVLPSIRKHGAYMTDVTIEKLADNPDLLIELCNKLKAERQKNEELKKENTIQSQKLLEYEPKATYYDLVLQSKGVIPITVIAKDFGITAYELNRILRDKKIQRKVSCVYVLNKKYADKGYTKSKTFVKNGMSYMSMYWTQSGRLFIYDTLKQIGILPLIESEVE